tara:strand:- start:50 stop:526 length:477 start_codon:yes stop_codon:yes gene_type:complete
MADRLDWKVSITPVKQTAAGSDGGGVQADVIAFDFKKSLGGGNSSQTWAGNNTDGWADDSGTPLHTHLTSDSGTTGAISSADGLWIKHTGYAFVSDAGLGNKSATADNTSTVVVKTGSTAICTLGAGEGVFLPKVANATYNLAIGSGSAVAVEYAIFT